MPPRCAPEELSTLFPTTLMRRHMPDAKSKNRRIRNIVLEREKADPGVHQSNVGGWHSTADLWDWPNRKIRDLCAWVKNAVQELTAAIVPLQPGDEVQADVYGGSWANVLRDGGYNKPHNHPGAIWSAVGMLFRRAVFRASGQRQFRIHGPARRERSWRQGDRSARARITDGLSRMVVPLRESVSRRRRTNFHRLEFQC